jgi:hypothetical protein
LKVFCPSNDCVVRSTMPFCVGEADSRSRRATDDDGCDSEKPSASSNSTTDTPSYSGVKSTARSVSDPAAAPVPTSSAPVPVPVPVPYSSSDAATGCVANQRPNLSRATSTHFRPAIQSPNRL